MPTKVGGKPPPFYPDSVRPPPVLPDATKLKECGLTFTPQEFDAVRTAMAIFAASRQPKLLWNGWKSVAIALAIGEKKALKKSNGRSDSPLYRRALTPFLNRSGLAFVNKDDRVALRKMLPQWDEIDQWRATLTPQARGKLNNPREVLDAFTEASKPGAEPSYKPPGKHGARRPQASQLDQVVALLQQIEMLHEQVASAERRSEYFATLLVEVNKRAGLSEEQLAELRAQVRAELAGEIAEPSEDPEA